MTGGCCGGTGPGVNSGGPAGATVTGGGATGGGAGANPGGGNCGAAGGATGGTIGAAATGAGMGGGGGWGGGTLAPIRSATFRNCSGSRRASACNQVRSSAWNFWRYTS